MTALTQKLIRDLLQFREQAVAIALVMACGIATFVMALGMMDSLRTTLDTYYDQHKFAHIFAHATRAPRTLVPRIAELPGVNSVQARIAKYALLDVPGIIGPASARIISLERNQELTGLHALHLRSGRLPEGRDRREVLISQRFAEANNLTPGHTLAAILNGRKEHLRIVGIALSPEFIYLIPPGAILPQHDRYAAIWMGRDEMEAAFDMEGAFNDLLIRAAPTANQSTIIERIDPLLARYGGRGAYTRKDHASHQIISNELDELRGMTLIIPTIFLSVSAFLLNIVLARLIETQHAQIAALRALGYTAREIGRHYLSFVLIISLVAAVVGIALGTMMGQGLTSLYADFFDFPSFEYQIQPRVLVIALAIAPAVGALAVASAIRKAMRLPPAEAMRPASPPAYRPTILERLGLSTLFSIPMRMLVRYLERRPVKTILSVIGISLATAILVLGSYTEDATDYIFDVQFNLIQQHDAMLVMYDTTDSAALADIRHLPGVLAAEPFRSVPVILRHGPTSRRTGILGIERSDGMNRLISMYAQPHELPKHGIVLSATLARILNISTGQPIEVETLEGRRRVFQSQVTSIIDDFSGLAAYMQLDELNRRMQEPGSIGGAFIQTDPSHHKELFREIRETPRIVAMNITASTEQSFRATVAKNLALMRTFLIGFSAIIAFGVIYSSARVSLSERSRDLASLRVIGFTRKEVGSMQLGELVIVTALGIPIGLALGYAFARLTAAATQTEFFRMPFVIFPSTFGIAMIVVLIAATCSGFVIVRRILHLDLVSVLKSRE